MNIRFYIPEKVTIPVSLKLMVDDTLVTYERGHRLVNSFRFYIDTSDENKAMKIAEEITQRIRTEQGDPKHGVTLVTTDLEIIRDERYFSKYQTVVDWSYRIRDSY